MQFASIQYDFKIKERLWTISRCIIDGNKWTSNKSMEQDTEYCELRITGVVLVG
jgi:hypothetical protein